MTADLHELESSPAAPAAGEHSRVPVDGGRRARREAQRSRSLPSIPKLWVREGKQAKEPAPRKGRRRKQSPMWAYVISVTTGVALLCLGFVFLLVVGSQFQAARDQQVLYSDFRKSLAEGTAPVSALTFEGQPLEIGAPVAVLAIPAIGEELVVVEGTASPQTMSGPGHRRDTVLPGQAGVSILMGRQSSFSGPFGSIGQLPVGAEIKVTTGQGFATYVVSGVRRAGDPQPPPLPAGGSRLTLISAEGTPFLAERTVRVDATLVSSSADGTTIDKVPFPAGPRAVTVATLPASDQAMAGDSSQAFALVLWAQAFLIAVIAFTWARERWGKWQAWTVGLPVLLGIGWAVSNQVAAFLPNLL